MEKISGDIYRFTAGEENAYFINGDTKILIDGVRCEYEREYLEAVSEITDFRGIDYYVVNKTEQNHSGTFEAVLKKNPDITVIASTAGLKFLSEMTELKFNQMLAKDNMELGVNGGVMKFILAPYTNSPDFMVTVYKNTVFFADSFYELMPKGASDALMKSLADENIDLTLSGTAGFDFKGLFSEDKSAAETLILYSSTYGNTERMAKTVQDICRRRGMTAELYDINAIGEKDAAKMIDECENLIIGINTINADAPKKLWRIIGETDKLSNKFKKCMLFGTYGWSGEGLYYVEKHLKMFRYNVFDKPFGAVFKLKTAETDKFAKYVNDFVKFVKNP